MVTVLGIAAAAWGIIMALAPVLQIRRMLARRSAEDLSLGYFGVLLPGFGLWLGYGVARADWALIVPNIAAITVTLLTIAVALVLRQSQRANANALKAELNSVQAQP